MFTITKLITSIGSSVLFNSLSNLVSKKNFKTDGDIYLFNAVLSLATLILFLFFLPGQATSAYTIIMGLIFGLLTVAANITKFHALSIGPMHITILFTTCQMIIPTLSGAVMFDEPFSIGKFVAMLFLLFFVYLSLDKSGTGKINIKWLIFCLICFFSTGAVGIMQKLHQSSVHRDETMSFLTAAFVCSTSFSFFFAKKNKSEAHFGVKEYIFAACCGITSFICNVFNLELSGILPSQLFFPVVNGVPLVLSSLVAIIIFKERVTPIQAVGLVGGTLSLVLLCIM